MFSAFDRRTAILNFLQEHHRASTRQLSELFDVSEVTIRTDLATLQAGGHVARCHGGAEIARPVHALQPEQAFELRRAQYAEEKAEIARAAAAAIQSGDHIVLDASSTAYQLALEIRDRRDLTVITNNLQAAVALAPSREIEVILIGGVVRGDNWSVVGFLAEELLAHLHARRGFFGAAGLTPERGLTDADVREVQLKRAMIAAVDEVHVLLDASKFGRNALLTFAELDAIDHLITDAGISGAYVELCRQHDIRLTMV